MANGTASEPEHESVVRNTLQQSELSGSQREVVQRALFDRMRQNVGSSRRQVDQQELAAAVAEIISELPTSTERYDLTEPEPLTSEQVNSVINSLCERRRLPWPICPAHD